MEKIMLLIKEMNLIIQNMIDISLSYTTLVNKVSDIQDEIKNNIDVSTLNSSEFLEVRSYINGIIHLLNAIEPKLQIGNSFNEEEKKNVIGIFQTFMRYFEQSKALSVEEKKVILARINLLYKATFQTTDNLIIFQSKVENKDNKEKKNIIQKYMNGLETYLSLFMKTRNDMMASIENNEQVSVKIVSLYNQMSKRLPYIKEESCKVKGIIAKYFSGNEDIPDLKELNIPKEISLNDLIYPPEITMEDLSPFLEKHVNSKEEKEVPKVFDVKADIVPNDYFQIQLNSLIYSNMSVGRNNEKSFGVSYYSPNTLRRASLVSCAFPDNTVKQFDNEEELIEALQSGAVIIGVHSTVGDQTKEGWYRIEDIKPLYKEKSMESKGLR